MKYQIIQLMAVISLSFNPLALPTQLVMPPYRARDLTIDTFHSKATISDIIWIERNSKNQKKNFQIFFTYRPNHSPLVAMPNLPSFPIIIPRRESKVIYESNNASQARTIYHNLLRVSTNGKYKAMGKISIFTPPLRFLQPEDHYGILAQSNTVQSNSEALNSLIRWGSSWYRLVTLEIIIVNKLL